MTNIKTIYQWLAESECMVINAGAGIGVLEALTEIDNQNL